MIPGVAFGRVTRHVDARGAFGEIYRASLVPGAAFVQANLSTSAAGVLRGLHYHLRQLDHWILLSGRAFVALVDVRPVLAGSGRPVVETRELGADETLTIPSGVAHGFLSLDPIEMLYLVTNEYDGSDELGVAWDDEALGIRWPAARTADGRPILSERDRSNPRLAELARRSRPS